MEISLWYDPTVICPCQEHSYVSVPSARLHCMRLYRSFIYTYHVSLRLRWGIDVYPLWYKWQRNGRAPLWLHESKQVFPGWHAWHTRTLHSNHLHGSGAFKSVVHVDITQKTNHKQSEHNCIIK